MTIHKVAIDFDTGEILRVSSLPLVDKAEIYHDMGMVYSRRGQYDEARIHYLQAIARDSLFAPSYHNLGNIQLRQGRIEEAIALFRDNYFGSHALWLDF